MEWYKVKWIPPMFDAFNAAFPQRNKASDGTIGDTAHMEGTSGHNPDDTSGVSAERQDSDSKPEVRAADVTSDFRDSRGIRMYDVVQRILATPAERNRLIYIICDGWVWRKSNGWIREKYTGSDQHYGHAHFSGDPLSDEDGGNWYSILSFTPEEEMTTAEINTHDRVYATLTMEPYGAATEVPIGTAIKAIRDDVSEIKETVGTGGITQEMLNAAVTYALQQPEVLDALKPLLNQAAFEGAQRAEGE